MNGIPKLVFDDGTVVYINNTSFTIGRSLSCDHTVESLGVSRFHCTIKRAGHKWILFDRSTNGTRVISKLYKFGDSVELSDGDVIKMGAEGATCVFTNPGFNAEHKEQMREATSAEMDDITSESDFMEDRLVVDEDRVSVDEPIEQPPKPEIKAEHMDSELTCSICSELFIKAVTLNCSHTFCQYCITEWRKNKSSCPICRQNIVTLSPTLVLENLIAKFISSQGEDVQKARKDVESLREELMRNAPSGCTAEPDSEIIELSEDDSYYNDDHSSFESDHDYSSHEPPFELDDFDEQIYGGGSRRSYYGGYGRCFICNAPGHWANACRYK